METPPPFRFDHNIVNDLTNGDWAINADTINGVFDHNIFDSTNQSNLFFFEPNNSGPDGSAKTEIWAQPDNFGTSQFVFIENNLIQNGAFAVDCDYGVPLRSTVQHCRFRHAPANARGRQWVRIDVDVGRKRGL